MNIGSLLRKFRSTPRSVFRWAGYDIIRYPSINRRRALEHTIACLTRNTVSSGLFSGLTLIDEESWGDLGSKLLGLYESELAPVLKDVIQSAPDIVINVGCAEGFYALGLAKLIPTAKVFAYDIDREARRICAAGAKINALDKALEIRGYCSAEELQRITKSAEHPFAIIDCEGGERELLLSTSYDYANTRFIIECHDFLDRTITDDLINKFMTTHTIEIIMQGGRNPFSSDIIKEWAENDLWLVVSEQRPERMRWLNLTPLTSSFHSGG